MGLLAEPGRGVAGSRALRKNTGSLSCSLYYWLKRAAWEDTHVMQMKAQADAIYVLSPNQVEDSYVGWNGVVFA